MKKIICVGSAARDIFLGVTIDDKQPRKICLKAGNKIYTDSYRETVGGGAVNVGAGLTKLGCRSFVFARTDKSATGKWIQKQIGKLGLKKNYMQQSGKIPSETSVIIADSFEQDRTILRSGDAVEGFKLLKAYQQFREKVDWIYLSSQKKNHLKNLDILINFAKEKKAKVAFNPSSYQIQNDAEEILLKLKEVDVLFLNLDEAVALLSEKISVYRRGDIIIEDNILKLIKKLLGFKMGIVALTDGSNGAWVASEGNNRSIIFHLPAKKVEKIIDTTGAGDAFVSGFLASLMINEDDLTVELLEKLKRALAGGIANSSNVISEMGAVNGLLKSSKLKRQIKIILKNIK